jgi:Uma2 family endonuclease
LAHIATPVQPDLLFIRQERREIIGEQRVEGAPDLVVEVLSPSSVRYDRYTKFTPYEKAGIPKYWIVNPKAFTIEIYHLQDEEYALAGEYGAGEQLVSATFGQLDIDVASLFHHDED